MLRLGTTARLAMIAIIATTVAACDTLGSTGLIASTAPADLSPTAAGAIASDMVSSFAENVGPGTNTIFLKSDGSAFAPALEAALKGRGYAVITDQPADKTRATALSYVVDESEGGVLVRLSTAALDLGRIYQATATGAQPTGPLSVTLHGTPA